MRSAVVLATIETPGLRRYEAACRAIAEAKSIDEVKDIRDKAEAMRAYARQAKNKQLEVDAAEIRFRAERRLGEMIAAQRDAGLLAKAGRPEIGSERDPIYSTPTLSDSGIDKHLADRARKYAAIPEHEFEARLAERRDAVEKANARVTVDLMAAGASHLRGTSGTGENEWYTPDEYIERARRVLGEIDLDPASSDGAQNVVGASNYYTAADNGLVQEWRGRVWLNPPYMQPLIGEFMAKLREEVSAGRCEAAIALTHNYTDTRWFQETASVASALCFTKGRVRFYSPEGDIAAPTQGQAFFYFGRNIDAFAREFADVGFIAEVRR
jgi:phage N-6-adenine-methyltransferase